MSTESTKISEEIRQKIITEAFGVPIPSTQTPAGPPADKYAVSSAWKKAEEFKLPFDYTIEAIGQTLLLQRLDMGDLLKLGIAEELDFMTKALMTSDKEVAQNPQAAMTSVVMKAENFTNMERMVNLVCNRGSIKPKLQLPPLDADGNINKNAKQPGQLYLDVIPFSDRMELFSVIFDTEGLSTFRSEQDAGVANVGDVQDVSLPAD